jgi:hypothetical protein
MLTNPRTLILTALAVLAVGCSKSPVTNVTLPTAQPTASVDATLPAAPAPDASSRDEFPKPVGLRDLKIEMPAAPLPPVGLPTNTPSGNPANIDFQSPGASASATKLRVDGTPTGLPRLPGMRRAAHGTPKLPSIENAVRLPGLPGNRVDSRRGLPVVDNHEGGQLPGLPAVGATPSAGVPAQDN